MSSDKSKSDSKMSHFFERDHSALLYLISVGVFFPGGLEATRIQMRRALPMCLLTTALRCAAVPVAVRCVRTRAHTTEAAVTGWWRHENTKEAPRGWAPAPGWVGGCAPFKLGLGPRHVNGLCWRIRPRMSALKKVKTPCLFVSMLKTLNDASEPEFYAFTCLIVVKNGESGRGRCVEAGQGFLRGKTRLLDY